MSGHQHDDSCYQDVLNCVRTVHQHAARCYENKVLTCPTPEHRHELSCYVRRLTCRR